MKVHKNTLIFTLSTLCCILFCMPLVCQNWHHKIDSVLQKHQIVGASLVTFEDQSITHTYFYGHSDLTNLQIIDSNTLFRCASVSKIITAIATMQLVANKYFSLDSDISKLLGFPIRNPIFPDVKITTGMLLTHTSTLTDEGNYDRFVDSLRLFSQIPSIQDFFEEGYQAPSKKMFLNHSPGKFYHYANINYLILGNLVECMSGLNFDEYCNRHIFAPLNIKAGFGYQKNLPAEVVSKTYIARDGKIYKGFDYNEFRNDFEKHYEYYQPCYNSAIYSPQGGLVIRAKDLARIIQELFNPKSKILTKKHAMQMTKSQWMRKAVKGDNYENLIFDYGLGLHLANKIKPFDEVMPKFGKTIGHPGEAYGLLSDLYFDLITKKGFLLILNGSKIPYENTNTGGFYRVEQDLFRIIQDIIIGQK